MGIRVKRLGLIGFGVWGLGFRVWSLGFRVWEKCLECPFPCVGLLVRFPFFVGGYFGLRAT